MKILIGLTLFSVFTGAYAMGNHPESNQCPGDKPHFVFCSHSLHNLEGWYGGCYASRDEAEDAVLRHAGEEHQGNTRWTGVKQIRAGDY